MAAPEAHRTPENDETRDRIDRFRLLVLEKHLVASDEGSLSLRRGNASPAPLLCHWPSAARVSSVKNAARPLRAMGASDQNPA